MLAQYEEKMKKTIESLEKEYSTIRAGRANPHILDRITVLYYGAPTPLQQVANITVPEARTIMISPWESSLIKEIEKAIVCSDLGINPNNDGKNIIINFPELTEDRRKELAKDVKKKGENAKVAIRNIRRDANDALKKANKAAEMSDDELKGNEEKVQKMTDKYVAQVDQEIVDGEELEIPTHVAIIMDGNGRWAKKRLLPRNMGHRQGAKVLEQICRDAADLGIRYLTVYAFSTENWKRSTEEVTGIMNLLRSYLSNCVERASKDGLRIRVIGDRSALDADIVEMLEHAERETAKFDKLDFTIALNYGGRDELRRTMTKLAKQVQEGTLAPEAITEDVIAKHLDTADLPDPDLLIRTSGELRLSNYLIWQLAYAEFYFTDTLWPDFDKESLKEAIRYYNGRERRFGGVK